MEVLLILVVFVFIVFVAIKGFEKPKAMENKDIPTSQTKEKRVVLIKEDKSMLLKYSILFVVFSLCLRFIVLPAVPTTFLVKHESGQSHIKLDHDWPSYKTIYIKN